MKGPVSAGLHIGVHKTATTHLQFSLGNSHEALLACGVRYYGPDYLRQRSRSIDQMFGLDQSGKARRSTTEQIAFLAKGDRRILFSEENTSGLLFDSQGDVLVPPYADCAGNVARLAERLDSAGVALDIYVALRSPASFLTSCYSQALMARNFRPPAEYVAHNRPSALDWTALVAALAALPHKRSLHVWRYEDYKEIFPQIVVAMAGPEAGAVVSPVDGVVHQGLSARALDALLEARDTGSGWLTPLRARRLHPVGPDSPPFVLYGPEEIRRDEARYAAQIASIAAMPGVSMIAPRGQG